MTTPRDFDRMARAWLDLMPDEAPDRLIHHVLQAVDDTPQVRRPVAPVVRRFFPMTRQSLTAVAAVLVVAVFGGALLLSRGFGVGSPTQAPPSTTPTPPATTVPTLTTGADLPAELIAGWFGGPRDLPGLAAGAGTILFLDNDQARFAQSNQQQTSLLTEQASLVDGRIQFVSTREESFPGGITCPRGTTGLYAYSLSESGRSVTLERFSDPCGPRWAILEGTWWKQGCWYDSACAGDLDAGTYGTQYFDPRVDPSATWAANYGALMFTVPAGWALAEDTPQAVRLTPSVSYAGEQAGEDPLAPAIRVVSQPFPKLGVDRCDAAPLPALDDPRSPTDIVTFLEAEAWLTASKPSTNMIDGHLTTVLDLAIAPGATPGCPGDTSPNADYLTGYGLDAWSVGLEGSQQARLLLVDLGDGDVVAIVIEHPDPSAFEAFVAEAMSIVTGFRFE